MKTAKEKVFIRVIPQLTILPNTVSLIAEEEKLGVKKGALVIKITRAKLARMIRPLRCELKESTTKSIKAVPITFD
jgi:hypothetical protein